MNVVELGFRFSFISGEGYFYLNSYFGKKSISVLKCSKIGIFEPKCHKNKDFKVKIFL